MNGHNFITFPRFTMKWRREAENMTIINNQVGYMRSFVVTLNRFQLKIMVRLDRHSTLPQHNKDHTADFAAV